MPSRHSPSSLQATHYEQASGFLSALLLLSVLLTAVMFAAWLSQQRRQFDTALTRVTLRANEHEIGGGSNGAADTAKTFEDQGIEDQSLAAESAAELLQTVSALATSELAAIEANGGPASGNGVGTELRDGRKKGPGSDGAVIPAEERWRIRYSAASLQEYAAILDAFGVELGVVGDGEQNIDYARNLSQTMPTTRQGKSATEKRLRFQFERGDLKESDKALAQKAGLSTEGRTVCQFFPDAVRKQLAHLEKGAIGDRPLESVRRTVFGIRQGPRGLEFHVLRSVFDSGLRVEPARRPGGLTPL